MALKIFSRILKKPVRQNPDILLYNTSTRKKERFLPLKAGRVHMYHCGPTVYGYQHIGNYRAYIFADILKRVFLQRGFSVKQVINITDVGHLTDDEDQGKDKVEEEAKREHKNAAELTKLYTDDYLDNLAKLNIDTSNTEFPRATLHILEQIAFIKTLEEKGYTYKTSDGIYYDTSLFKTYGSLGKIDISGLEEGKRVAVNPEKRNPTDFALWKFSKPNENRQQEWDSHWGVGFPGWHIECSAMSTKYLGHHFDIHTGGIDHIPVHHNNEIAQSQAALGTKYVNYWMHSAHVLIDGKKISKSLGNTILLKHIEERGMSPLSFRYWILTSHYRTQINFTWEAVEAAHKAFFRLEKFFVEELGSKIGNISEAYLFEFLKFVRDDLDTPKAIAVLWNLIKDEKVPKQDKKATMLEFDKILGLNLMEAQKFIEKSQAKIVSLEDIPEEVSKLLEEREIARKNKDFGKADEIRGKISSLGFDITDTEQGTVLSLQSSSK